MSRGRPREGRVFRPKFGPKDARKESNVWWLDYSVNGRRIRESSGLTGKAAARKLLNSRMAAFAEGRLVATDEKKVTFEDLVSLVEADYKRRDHRSHLRTRIRHLSEFFGGDTALSITYARIGQYTEKRLEEGAARATIQRELAVLKRGFNIAVKKARILTTRPEIEPVEVVGMNARQGFFQPADLERVIEELPVHLRAVVRFAAYTGWRKSEVLDLKWGGVDFNAGEVRLAPSETKNKKGREFPFAGLPPLANLLHEQRELTRSLERKTGSLIPYVFHRDGRPIKDMYAAWRSACKRAGMEGWLFHDLRRTAVKNLEKAGVARSVSMKLTGHLTESVFRRYSITESGVLAEGVAKLAALHSAPTEPRKVIPITDAAKEA